MSACRTNPAFAFYHHDLSQMQRRWLFLAHAALHKIFILAVEWLPR